jgi:hypothetical protein
MKFQSFFIGEQASIIYADSVEQEDVFFLDEDRPLDWDLTAYNGYVSYL